MAPMRAISRRAFLGASAALVSLPALATSGRAKPRRILFVCQFGSVKSSIARELLKRRARERQVTLDVYSRGITPEEHLPAAIKAKLIAEGINPAAEPLRALRQVDVDDADRVIIFDRLPMSLHAHILDDWTTPPSILNDYEMARADLGRRIDKLIEEEKGRR